MKFLFAGIIIISGLISITIGCNKAALSQLNSKIYQKHPIVYRSLYICGGIIVVLVGVLCVINLIHL